MSEDNIREKIENILGGYAVITGMSEMPLSIESYCTLREQAVKELKYGEFTITNDNISTVKKSPPVNLTSSDIYVPPEFTSPAPVVNMRNYSQENKTKKVSEVPSHKQVAQKTETDLAAKELAILNSIKD